MSPWRRSAEGDVEVHDCLECRMIGTGAMLGISGDGMPLIKRVQAIEEGALGEAGSGTIPDRIAAVEGALGMVGS